MASLVTAFAITLLLAAAWRDVASRVIPNELCAAVALSGVALQAMQGPAALLAAIGVAALLFGALLVPFAAGALGGGDVKLASALALGLAPLQAWQFITATAIAGGMLGLLYITLNRALPRRGSAPPRGASLPRRVLLAELHRIRRRGTLPYGVAIAAGGAFVLLTRTGA